MRVRSPDRSAGSNSITLRSAGSTRDTLELEIFASDVTNVHSVFITVVYPTNLLRFNNYQDGAFMASSIPVVITVFDNVVITQVRIAPQGVSGSGTIGVLTFSAIAEGASRIDFLEPEALDPAGQVIPGVDWIGGQVQVIF